MSKANSIIVRSLRRSAATLLLFVTSVVANAYDFEAKNGDRVTIYYNILSSSDKTCAVVNLYSTASLNSVAYSGDVSIPETVTYNGTTYTVTEIGSYAFYGCTGLTKVTIPEGVTTIGSSAFYQCKSLMEVNFNAIACTYAGNTVAALNVIVFSGCDNLSTFNFGDKVTIIPNVLCYNLTSLKSATIPNSVTSIGDYAFYNCTGLTSELIIPNSVTSIGDYAFYNCTGLTGELIIPESVTSIGGHTFYGCSGLSSVTIPNSVTSIGNYAFCYCTGLTGELVIPESVTEMGGYTFYGCSGLSSVTIPNSVTSIGDYAFYNCTGLRSATIGYRVTSISNYAFYRTNLREIYSKNPTPPDIGARTFYGVDNNTCILYVPVNSKNRYSTADYWSEFINIEEMKFDDVLIVQTYEATEVTTNSALLRGVVTVGNEEVLEQGFEYWTEGGDVQTITSPDLIMAVTLSGLEDGVTYTYRAYAIIENYTIYSEEMTFTTIKAPTVQTYEATEITENSALLKGYVTAGNEDVLGQGFEYWAAGGEVQTIAMSDQMMAVTVTGLNEGTTYTCRAYANTASGTTYGNEVTFTTLGTATITPPTVQTYEATEVTENSATLSGVVVAGSEKVTELGFEYWSFSNDVQTVASTGSSMSVTVANLKSSTTYTYRAYAKTESGTTYGNEVAFTTLDYVDGVSDVNAELEVEARYTTEGKKISQPMRGMNIIRYSDGTVRKVLVQ